MNMLAVSTKLSWPPPLLQYPITIPTKYKSEITIFLIIAP